MGRKVGAVFAGLMIFAILTLFAGLVVRSIWPAYAAAVPQRDYTLPMLVTRLIAGATATVIAASATSRIAQGDRLSALWLGIMLLVISIPWHIHIWREYPTWYHLVWFGCLIPCALLGGRARCVPLR